MGFDAGDSNLYRYVNNRPTQAIDPTGQDFILPADRPDFDAAIKWQIGTIGKLSFLLETLPGGRKALVLDPMTTSQEVEYARQELLKNHNADYVNKMLASAYYSKTKLNIYTGPEGWGETNLTPAEAKALSGHRALNLPQWGKSQGPTIDRKLGLFPGPLAGADLENDPLANLKLFPNQPMMPHPAKNFDIFNAALAQRKGVPNQQFVPKQAANQGKSPPSVVKTVVDVTLVVGSSEWIPKAFGGGQLTEGTSIFSRLFGRFGNLPFRLPAPTSANWWATTNRVGRFVGRWAYPVGFVLTIWDAGEWATYFMDQADQKMKSPFFEEPPFLFPFAPNPNYKGGA